ncbi:outer membrane biogenesis protein BamB [Symmachiella dynata]|uniref:Outer membrane biogenesis protein BamB n=1 Tax=Symmachiella dynata TaxID=2527995 RepID=A0A517ZGM0_9PLAN|nr:PQQ-binding-like beta-propeller repeat protein [Symmachiella dynata]QDU41626.1 outer membrane biogenesis protein BamB [Symmachiella dynata]
MPRVYMVLAVALLFVVESTGCAEQESGTAVATPAKISVSEADWPWWRGFQRNGIAPDGQSPPTTWSKDENVIWKAPIPGRGHSSPTVVGDRVFITTADEEQQTQSVICFDRETGNQLWKTDVHTGGLTDKGNKKSTQASSTVACDGERLFINFLNNDAVYTTALTIDGKKLWQKKVTDYVVHQGYGSSPAIYGSVVIVSADNKGGGAIAAFDRESGELTWKHKRPSEPNYASPIILNVAGKDQVIFTGCDLVSSYDPLTGKQNWEVEGATTECVTSTPTDGNLVFSSGGYPKNHVSAIRGDGSGEIAWENKTRVYVPSMLVIDGHLYAVSDKGIVYCWKSDSGEELWKKRIGGPFTSTPVLAGGRLYATTEDATTYVVTVSPEGLENVSKNQLGDETYATPAICGNRIYMRVVETVDGERREMLYCLGE